MAKNNPIPHSIFVATENDMIEFGQQLALSLPKPCVMTLSGDLGAGKSVLARAMIRALGHVGAVKSPTYTLVENYELDGWRIAHMDLYRLNDPEELQYLGFDDIVANSDLLLIEWPDKGAGLLPKPNLEVTIEYQENGRQVVISS